jgi:hypothetical protein
MSAMMAALHTEDAETVLSVFSCFYSHTSAAIDALADTARRDQWLAEVDDVSARVAEQQAAFGE